MTALMALLTRPQRIALAALLTLVGVVSMEVAHFSSGTSIVLEVSYFAIPAALAFALFEAWRERVVAFILLTLLGIIGAGAAILVVLTPR